MGRDDVYPFYNPNFLFLTHLRVGGTFVALAPVQ
jgi:hypothetical protein